MERKRRLRNVVLAIIGVVALVTIIGGIRLGPSGWDVAPEIRTYADTKLVQLDAEKLRGIPGVIVQGRHDCCTPPRAAWELKRAWPEVELNIVPDGGHLYNEPGILDGLIRATDRFAG